MSIYKQDFVPRRPRYSVAEGQAAKFWLERAQGRLAAELASFSRHGAGLLTSLPADIGERVTVRICLAPSGLDLSFAGTVRWKHVDRSGRWFAGLEFEQPISFEALGELFLTGILEEYPPRSP